MGDSLEKSSNAIKVLSSDVRAMNNILIANSHGNGWIYLTQPSNIQYSRGLIARKALRSAEPLAMFPAHKIRPKVSVVCLHQQREQPTRSDHNLATVARALAVEGAQVKRRRSGD